MAANLTPFSRKRWRDSGYHVETTEFFAQVAGGLPRRHDLFGFVDLLALPISGSAIHEPWVFIQVTSWGNVSSRINKIARESHGKGQWEVPMAVLARAIWARGDRLIVEGWKKDKEGKKGPKGRYIFRETEITPQLLEERR